MGRKLLITVSILLFYCSSATAEQPARRFGESGQRGVGQGRFAQGGLGQGGAQGRRGEMLGRVIKALPVMVALDADQDGILSAEEIENAPVALRTLDKNKDSQIDAEEMRPTFPGAGDRTVDGMDRSQFAERVFTRVDADGDGKLTGDEIPERMRGRLDQIDTDGDGSVDKAELQDVFAYSRGRSTKESGAQGVAPKRP